MYIKKRALAAKNHVVEHKEFYIGISVGLALAGITYIIVRGKPLGKELHTTLDAGVDCPVKESMGSFSVFSGRSIFGSVTNNSVVTTIHKNSKGNPGFITRCIETGDVFDTQGDAARFFNIPEEIMSKHLNYGRKLKEKLHFERVAAA